MTDDDLLRAIDSFLSVMPRRLSLSQHGQAVRLIREFIAYLPAYREQRDRPPTGWPIFSGCGFIRKHEAKDGMWEWKCQRCSDRIFARSPEHAKQIHPICTATTIAES